MERRRLPSYRRTPVNRSFVKIVTPVKMSKQLLLVPARKLVATHSPVPNWYVASGFPSELSGLDLTKYANKSKSHNKPRGQNSTHVFSSSSEWRDVNTRRSRRDAFAGQRWENSLGTILFQLVEGIKKGGPTFCQRSKFELP